jgi:hypothetical protein
VGQKELVSVSMACMITIISPLSIEISESLRTEWLAQMLPTLYPANQSPKRRLDQPVRFGGEHV